MSEIIPPIPPSTSETVTFPLNQYCDYFDTKPYDPKLMGDQISLDKINKFMSDIDKEYQRYKPLATSEKSKCVCFGYTAIFIFILDFLMLVSPFSKEYFLSLFTNGETIILSWFLLFCLHMCGCLCAFQSNTDLLSELKDKCQDLVDKQNETLRSQGLKLHLPDEFPAWIELTRDIQKRNDYFAIPGGIPETRGNTIIFSHHRYKSSEKYRETWQFTHDFFSPEMTDG